MAVLQQQTLPQQYVNQLGQDYGQQLAGLTSIPLDTSTFAPQVAGQDPLQTQAASLAASGVGGYQPYLSQAATQGTQAISTLGGVSPYISAAGQLTGTGAGTGAGSIASYMSPYQQQVIDATMTEFDEQAKMRENQRAAAALGVPGAYGGGREGVQKAEYEATSDRNRAALLAQLEQQGFQQAQAARQQDFANQQALATQQAGLGTQALGNVQRQIAGLGTLGATQQAQNQAVLDAQRQFASMAVNEPQQRLGTLGSGVIGLMGGTQGLGTTYQQTPQSSPLASALGIGSTLAGIYGMGSR